MSWSKKRDNCANCSTSERYHKARGLCDLCYHLTRKLEATESWQSGKRSTLKGYPFINFRRFSHGKFEKYKCRVVQYYRDELSFIAQREADLKGYVDGLDLEYGFGRIAKLAGAKQYNLFHGSCGWYETVFNLSQRQELFRIIDKIEKVANKRKNIAALLNDM